MPTYFGETTTSANFDHNTPPVSVLNYTNYGSQFTCPGSGDQTLVELSAYMKSGGGTPGNVRLALYEGGTTVNKIAEGTAEVTVSSTTAGWVGHLSQSDITPNPTTLTGGTDYTIVVSVDSNDVYHCYNTPVISQRINNTDYTGGYPASLNKNVGWGGAAADYTMRAGVEAAGGATPINAVMTEDMNQ